MQPTLFHVPAVQVSWEPTTGVPETVGGAVLVGIGATVLLGAAALLPPVLVATTVQLMRSPMSLSTTLRVTDEAEVVTGVPTAEPERSHR